MIQKKKILYIESNVDGTIGGSHLCLLSFIEDLDRKRYMPLVGFYQKNRLIPDFEQAGAKVKLFEKPGGINILESFPLLKELSNRTITNLIIVKPLTIMQKIINYLRTFIIPSFRCWYFLRKEQIDLVHLNNTLLRPQEWILASLFNKAKIIAHERGINESFPLQCRFWSRFLNTIICISGVVKNGLIKHGFSKEKLLLIYDGLDPDKFTASIPKEEIFKEFGIEPGCPVVGIVGNIKKWKGQEVVILAMKQTLKSFNNLKCLIIGGISNRDMDRKYLEYLKNIVKKEGLENCVIFTGQREDVPSLINSLNVLIHASIQPEPFGRVNLEGMALGKPVISTTIGAGSEIVEEGKTGFVVPPGDERCLADAICSLLKYPEKAEEMGKKGRARLNKYFHLSITTKKTEELYSRLLNT